MVYIVKLEFPNLHLKQQPNKTLFAVETCKVAVNYWIYDKRKKIVVCSGSSRPCGCNYHKTSIHAEQRALEYIRHTKNRHLEIYIWKWGKCGDLKPAYCCISCKQLLHKYKYQNNIFTFKNDKIVSAIIDNPGLSLGYMIKYGLSY